MASRGLPPRNSPNRCIWSSSWKPGRHRRGMVYVTFRPRLGGGRGARFPALPARRPRLRPPRTRSALPCHPGRGTGQRATASRLRLGPATAPGRLHHRGPAALRRRAEPPAARPGRTASCGAATSASAPARSSGWPGGRRPSGQLDVRGMNAGTRPRPGRASVRSQPGLSRTAGSGAAQGRRASARAMLYSAIAGHPRCVKIHPWLASASGFSR
jgi:hypothetical protein